MAQINWSANPVGSVFAYGVDEGTDGVFRLQSGGYEVFTIISADKNFQPASLYYGIDNRDKAKVDAMVPDGKVPTSMNCFMVRVPDGFIMFDTGLPASKGGKTLERLSLLNISPDEVKAVYLTHGHFDHIGGLVDENGKAVFESATVYISEEELVSLRDTSGNFIAEIESAYCNRIVTFTPGEILPDNVLPIAAKGHTPGHTVYLLGNLLFAGDIMHGPELQLLDPEICANFDADREQAIATRIRVLSFAASNSLTVLGAHVPLNGVLF